jgi:hypothetical protein
MTTTAARQYPRILATPVRPALVHTSETGERMGYWTSSDDNDATDEYYNYDTGEYRIDEDSIDEDSIPAEYYGTGIDKRDRLRIITEDDIDAEYDVESEDARMREFDLDEWIREGIA